MWRTKPVVGLLSLAGIATFLSDQTASTASELNQGEWRIAFNGIQKSEGVKVKIKAEGASIVMTGTPDNLGVIFKTQSGKFQPAQKLVGNRASHFLLTEPVIVTVRRNGKEVLRLATSQADIEYEKVK